jgi:hypothetical protein
MHIKECADVLRRASEVESGAEPYHTNSVPDTMTIEWPSPPSPGRGPCSLFFCAFRPLRLVKCQRPHPTNRRDPRVPRSCLDTCRGQRAASGGDRASGLPAVRAHPTSTTPCGRAATHSVDQGAAAATAASVHRIGPAAIGN